MTGAAWAQWLVWFLRCLTAAWLATAFLYGMSVGTLPEPIVGLVTAAGLALVMATAVVATGLDHARGVTLQPQSGQPSAGWSPSRTSSSRPRTQTSVPYEPPSLGPNRPSSASPGASPVADTPPVPAAPSLDLSAYPQATPGMRQCPRCGSFAVATSEESEEAAPANTCRICSQVWRSGADIPDPDVVVRSWLHR